MIALDFNSRGHHPSYIAKIAASNWPGRIVTSKAGAERARHNLQPQYLPRIDAIDIAPEAFDEHVKWVNEILVHSKVIHLAIDDLFGALVRRPSFWIGKGQHLSGLWMSSNFFYGRRGSVRYQMLWAFFKIFLARQVCAYRRQGWGKMLFLNEELAAHLRRSPLFRQWVEWCPDPPDDYGPIKTAPDSQGRRVLFFGEHTGRKGTEWALTALKRWRGFPLEIVIAGEWKGDRPLSSYMSELPALVRVTDRTGYLSSSDVKLVFAQADAVALPYRRFGGSSGVLNSAVSHGIPVVIPDFGLLASRCVRYGVGSVFEHDSEQSFVDAVRASLGIELQRNARRASEVFVRDHGMNAFVRTLQGAVR